MSALQNYGDADLRPDFIFPLKTRPLRYLDSAAQRHARKRAAVPQSLDLIG